MARTGKCVTRLFGPLRWAELHRQPGTITGVAKPLRSKSRESRRVTVDQVVLKIRQSKSDRENKKNTARNSGGVFGI